MRDVVAVVVAAGSGERLGHALPKALVPLAGRPLLAHAVDGIVMAGVRQLVVVAPADDVVTCREVATTAVERTGWSADVEVEVVTGGATRSASVRAGLQAAARLTPQVIAIHDAARCLTPASVHRRVLDALGGDVVAAAPGLPVPDTLKRVDAEGEVTGTVDRTGAWAVHTPQAFAAAVLQAVHGWAGDRDATDDLGLFELARGAGATSGRAVLVEGSVLDLKITWPRDLEVAAALLAAGLSDGAPSEVAG